MQSFCISAGEYFRTSSSMLKLLLSSFYFSFIVAEELVSNPVDVTPYIKNGDVFERTISYTVAPSEVPEEGDYLYTMYALFKALNSGAKPVTLNDMNKFEDGLNQYYQSQAHIEYYSLNKLTPVSNPSEPVELDDKTSSDSEGGLTFYRVKVFGYPAFKKNTRMYVGLDSSSLIKEFTVHFNGTSDVVIFNGYFKIKSTSYYFVYHTYDNVYHSAINKIRTINGLVKTKQATDSLSISSEVFVHTYDSTDEDHSRINATVHSRFQKVLRNTYLPKLATLADAKLVADYTIESSKLFYKAYRGKVVDTVMMSFEKYMKLKGQSSFTFTPIKFTRPVTDTLTMVQQFTCTIDGVLNYEKYELLKPSEKNYDETSGVLSMMDVIRINYPQTGDKRSTFILDIRDDRGISNQKNYTVGSIQILSAYKANLTTYPIRVVRDLDKWPYTNTGFVSKIQLANFNNIFDFAVFHAVREIGIAIGSLFVDVTPYIKNGNVFERTVSYTVAPSEEPGERDYLYTMYALFKALNSGAKPVTLNDMNKFEDGLHQYYQSQAHIEYYSLNEFTPASNHSDPVDLEDTTSGDSEDGLTFYRVKALGFPAFKKNTKMCSVLDSSPLIKDFTVHFNGTSDMIIFNGYFHIKSTSYYFVYHTYGNVYHSAIYKIRTINGLVKPKLTTDSLSISSEVFIHTYDSTEEEHSRINATVYSAFQKVLRNTYLPKLAALADAKLVAGYATETSKLFYKAYREKVVDTVLISFEKYMKLKGQTCFTFTPIKFTRPVTDTLTMVQQFTGTIDAVLNYEKYELLKPTEKKFDETAGILRMSDIVRITYPQTGDKRSTFILDIRDERGISNQKNYTIESIHILSAYKANVTTYPVHVVRDLDKWPYTNTGFIGKIQLINFDNLFDFAVYHAEREIGIAIGSLFGINP